jgi:hypothetical protein
METSKNPDYFKHGAQTPARPKQIAPVPHNEATYGLSLTVTDYYLRLIYDRCGQTRLVGC